MSDFEKRFEEKFDDATRLTGEIPENVGVKAAGIGLTAGTAAAAGAAAGVAAAGTASTGTAIAALSGAAATKATLAALGGGSLAAGGAGVAGGMIVLGTGGLAVFAAAGFGAYWYMTRRVASGGTTTPPDDPHIGERFAESGEEERRQVVSGEARSAEALHYVRSLYAVAISEQNISSREAQFLRTVAAEFGFREEAIACRPDSEPWKQITDVTMQKLLVKDLLLLAHADNARGLEENAAIARIRHHFGIADDQFDALEAFAKQTIAWINQASMVFDRE